MFAVLSVCFSCTNDDMENFDKSATERLEERIDEVKTLLTASEHGWVMKYYIGSAQSGGGYTYTVKFSENEAEVGFELANTITGNELDETITSLYKITDDNGPVLTFDTYNKYLHYFSTPSGSNYQALGGDFEFEIFEVTPTKITMLGRRSRNTITLEPLSVEPSEYLKGVESISKNFIPYYLDGTAAGSAVSGTVDYSTRHITLQLGETSYSSAFCFTPSGISLYKPIEVGGSDITDLAYDVETLKLSASSIDVTGSVPEGWVPFENYAGTYRLDYTGNFYVKVTLTPGQYNSTYIMSGVNKNFDIILNYNMQTGKLQMNSQMVGTVDNYSIYFCAWALDCGGSVTWAPQAGMQTVWNNDTENPVYTFEPNGYFWRNGSGEKCVTDSFILFAVSSSDVFYFDRAAWGSNGYAQWPYIESLTKL